VSGQGRNRLRIEIQSPGDVIDCIAAAGGDLRSGEVNAQKNGSCTIEGKSYFSQFFLLFRHLCHHMFSAVWVAGAEEGRLKNS
jgi:hypothetical protein